MEEYESNSHKSKEEAKALSEKKVGKVISGSAKTKSGKMKKLVGEFISDDINNVKSYVLMDVLVPAVKKAISDIVRNGIDMILYGESGRSDKRLSGTKVSYGGYYERDRDTNRRERRRSSSRGYDYDEVVFETRGDAETVLDAMNDIIAQYGVVSVGDFYDLADVDTSNYAANKYGWTDISGAKAVRVRDGYILKLPKAFPLN